MAKFWQSPLFITLQQVVWPEKDTRLLFFFSQRIPVEGITVKSQKCKLMIFKTVLGYAQMVVQSITIKGLFEAGDVFGIGSAA